MPRTIIEDRIKRQVVALMSAGHKAPYVADKVGIKVETIANNWKRWQKEIRDELPDIVKPYVKGPEITENEEEKQMEISKNIAVVTLVGKVEELLKEYLMSGSAIEYLKVMADIGNEVELTTNAETEAIEARLMLRVTVLLDKEETADGVS